MLFHAQAFVYFWVEWWFYKVIATWNVLIKWPEVVQVRINTIISKLVIGVI